jgi:hypothetical protein
MSFVSNKKMSLFFKYLNNLSRDIFISNGKEKKKISKANLRKVIQCSFILKLHFKRLNKLLHSDDFAAYTSTYLSKFFLNIYILSHTFILYFDEEKETIYFIIVKACYIKYITFSFFTSAFFLHTH